MHLKKYFFKGLLLLIILTPVAYAYADPGSGALLMQMLSAALLGVAFFFYKVKTWFIKLVHKKQQK